MHLLKNEQRWRLTTHLWSLRAHPIEAQWQQQEETELLDYESDGEEHTAVATKKERGNYVSVHSSTFKDFLLKEELLRSIADCGFEHPSEGLVCCLKSPSYRIHSPARGHSSSYSRQRYCVPSQVWYGQDCCVRPFYSPSS